MTKVYVVRHAEAEGNLYGRPHAWYDGHLTSLGRRQIKAFAERVKGIEFAAAYSSDRTRTMQTIGAVLESRPALKLNVTPRLRELHLGEWEDSTWGYLARTCPDMLWYYRNDLSRWHPKGAENFEDCKDRMYNFIVEKALRHKGKNILCASHGFAIRALLSKVKNIPSDRIAEVPFCGNTALSVFGVDDNGNVTVELENDFSHLEKDDAQGPLTRKMMSHSIQSVVFDELDEKRDGDFYKSANPGGDLDKISALREKYARCCAVAECEGGKAGIIELDPDRERGFGKGWISFYFIDEKFRSRGISRALIGYACSVYRELGREKIVLAVDKNDADLIKYFEYYAFEKAGETDSEGVEKILMEYDLTL